MSAPEARRRLLDHLAALGIDAPIVDYPAHSTVEEGKTLRAQMTGTFTKNLLLRDKKSRLFLLSAHEDTAVDLKTLHTRIGAQGRLGFAAPISCGPCSTSNRAPSHRSHC